MMMVVVIHVMLMMNGAANDDDDNMFCCTNVRAIYPCPYNQNYVIKHLFIFLLSM